VIPPGLEHLLPAYRADIKADFDQLIQLAQDRSADRAYHAHAMGGKCAMMGDSLLADLLYQLEAAGQDDHAGTLLEAIRHEVEIVINNTDGGLS
jgi:hypothetical protein